MGADVISSILGLTLQATGNNNNDWGAVLNGSALVPLERAIAGNISHAVTGGTLDLSGSPPPSGITQPLDMLQVFTGALTVNQIVILPNLSKFWLMDNQTTRSFQLLMQTPSGAFINIPQGTTKFVACDGQGNLVRLDRDQVGNFEYNAVASAGTMSANGASVLKTDFPDLYSKYGTTFGSVDSLHFTLPLLTDTGRFLRSTTSTLAVGTYQANQNKSHTHTGSGTTATESASHTHNGSGTTGAMSANASHTHTTGWLGSDGSTQEAAPQGAILCWSIKAPYKSTPPTRTTPTLIPSPPPSRARPTLTPIPSRLRPDRRTGGATRILGRRRQHSVLNMRTALNAKSSAAQPSHQAQLC